MVPSPSSIVSTLNKPWIKSELYDCYGKTAMIEQTENNKQGLFNNFYAILPKNELEDETI